MFLFEVSRMFQRWNVHSLYLYFLFERKLGLYCYLFSVQALNDWNFEYRMRSGHERGGMKKSIRWLEDPASLAVSFAERKGKVGKYPERRRRATEDGYLGMKNKEK